MSDTYYPPGGFYFTVSVLGTGTAFALASGVDASFQEVSGIEAKFDTESVTEGGENRFVHRLPKPASYSNLVLKRGIVAVDSFFVEWVGQTVGSGLSLPILPQNILVTLLNEEGSPLVVWGFVNAWPIRSQIAPLNASENKVLIETMELSYNYFDRVNLGGGVSAAIKLAQLTARLM